MRNAGSPSKDSISDKHKIENTKTGIQSSKPDSCFLLSHLTKTTLRFNFLKLRFNFFFLCFNFPKLEFVHTETKSHKTKTSVRKCKSKSNARFCLRLSSIIITKRFFLRIYFPNLYSLIIGR